MNSVPLDYEKSVLTSRPERCTISQKSGNGICRYINPPNTSTVLCTARRISVGALNAALLSEVSTSMNMLQGQTYNVIDLLLCMRMLLVQITSGSPNVKVSKALT